MGVRLALVCVILAGCGRVGFDGPTDPDAGVAGLPAIGFAFANTLVDEASGAIEVGIELSEPSSQAVQVHWSRLGGTATSGADYTASNGGILTIPPGETSTAVPLTILADSIAEDDETILLGLDSAVGATISKRTNTITISANILPRVGVTTVTGSGAETTSTGTITVRLDAASASEVTVGYFIEGTANIEVDFDLPAGPLTFPPGVTSKTLTLTILDDPMDEFDETVTLHLGEPTGAVIGDGIGTYTYTIVDDDDPPVAEFQNVSLIFPEAGGMATINLGLSAASGKPVTVPLSLNVGSTATAPADFSMPDSPVVFDPGATTKAIQVPVVNDTDVEADEVVIFDLGAPTNATLGASTSSVISIVDDD